MMVDQFTRPWGPGHRPTAAQVYEAAHRLGVIAYGEHVGGEIVTDIAEIMPERHVAYARCLARVLPENGGTREEFAEVQALMETIKAGII